ncbi:16S rRNA (adenine(1518)-N(6)/adenine(1519)-N(6))-dimethyltransferase RsmA [Fervidobacterium thailandense]|uniref:Ribosomal RNA small subunit methyltransferase A n=1 Tax=Fervidobacterium thailandense TaxID=1008305 RepID=A0A1E3G3T1_9BACT|nr:16S rRNA (adenine(1518)-N(6)/adenine(1519)-N(6))-dimethyltransferase RsmA [Fervidobacterium thailandense]ODN30869.1 ribosomal RNA small subunit methyltransferase A [Fervidobacterium thailandense]
MKTSDYLRKYGIALKKSLGQNFLASDDYARRIVEAVEVKSEDVILEIGAGAGTLTVALANTGAKVFAVEIDTRLKPILEERLSGYKNVELIFEDFLKLDLSFLPKSYRCVSNIPYYITAPIIKKLLFTDFSDLVLMVQSEVGGRLAERPGSSNRGFLSVVVQTIGTVERVLTVPRSAFVPNPEVESVVLRIRKREMVPFRNHQELLDFWDFVSKCFAKKRKTITNNLKSFVQVEDIPYVLGPILTNLRPEEISEEDFVHMWHRYREVSSR